MICNRLIFCLVAALASSGCVGTEVGNPQDNESEVTVEFTAEPQDPRALTLSNGIDISEAWMGVEEVGLRESSRCEDSERFDDESPFAVELITGEEIPGAAMLTQTATSFCRLELELESVAESIPGAPEALGEASIYMIGTLEDGTPFEVLAEVTETVRLQGPFDAAGTTRLLVSFDLQNWLIPEDFEGIEPDANGTLILDPEVAGDVNERIAQAVLESARLIRDNNENGVLDDGDEVVATSAETLEQ